MIAVLEELSVSRYRRPALLATVFPVLALGLASCSSAIEQSELETQVANAIEGQIGSLPEVSCPSDLDAEVDATIECTVTDPGSGDEVGVRVTVTSVEGETAEFDIEVIE